MIRALSSEQDREGFIRIFGAAQARLRQDPYRVGLLAESVAQGFARAAQPFPTEFWLAEEDGELVGRIGAAMSGLSWEGRKTAAIGFFECDPARPIVARSLMEAASAWARAQGAERLVGPMNFNTWFSYRFRVGDASGALASGEAPFAFEPVNPPEYPRWFETWGFRPVERYHSQAFSLEGLAEKTAPDRERALAAGYTLRELDSGALLEKEVPILHRISMECFKDNFLFQPLPFELFRQLYVPIAGKADFRLSRFVVDPNGREVGFFFVLREREYAVMKTIAMLPEGRGKGLSNALFHESSRAALELGHRSAIAALVRSGAQSESYARKSQELWRHDYVLYGKEA
ncbi:MAG: GNAT family N-acetyltransferase [Oligoflexia bacterium]|nr:GNAT family N-acetyltransferase [Oligoflexia bacterium]